MASPTASRRYAKAVLLLANEAKQAQQVLDEMRDIRSTINASSELRALLNSPVIKTEKKASILKAVFSSASELMVRLIDLLAERQKLGLLTEIASHVERLYNDANGIAEVTLTSVEPLDAAHTNAVKAVLELKTGKTITIHSQTDASLLGGITVQLGDTMYDGSVRHSLEKLDMLLHAPIA
jgi:F-type H+-transporting ATPase subunit delta